MINCLLKLSLPIKAFLNILEDVSGLCNRLPSLICQSVEKGASYPGGNLIIAGRNAHPVQGRKLMILEPLKGFQDQKPITLPKRALGLALYRCGYKK